MTVQIDPNKLAECSMDGCTRSINSRGLCNAHRQSEMKAGRLAPLTPWDRLLRKSMLVNDCLIWTGYVNDNGYPGNGEHRKSLSIKLGRPVAKGMDACHNCDTRACINPTHLYEGTRRQNMSDCTERNRHNKPTGEAHWSATIPDDAVREMHQLTADGWTRKAIGERFGIHPATASRIVRGIWRKEMAA